MKIAKNINNTLDFVEIENGIEVNGHRTEQSLLEQGYKLACPYLGDEQGTHKWVEYPTCWVEELTPITPILETMEEPDNE